jgi:hypothetical protein
MSLNKKGLKMLNQTIQNSISYPPIGGFLIFYSYNLIFNMNVKMQNKAKFKTTQIAVTLYMARANKKGQRNPQPKNKPKQTQINPLMPTAYCLLPDIKKMTNKPNFESAIITVSDYSKTGYCSLMTGDCFKNKPKRTQFGNLFRWPFEELSLQYNIFRNQNETISAKE